MLRPAKRLAAALVRAANRPATAYDRDEHAAGAEYAEGARGDVIAHGVEHDIEAVDVSGESVPR